MKKILVIILLFATFWGSSQTINDGVTLTKTIDKYSTYKRSSEFQGGVINSVQHTNAYYWLCLRDGTYDSIQFAFVGQAALTVSDLTEPDPTVNTIYDLGDSLRLGTQGTTTNQPWLTGHITGSKDGSVNPQATGLGLKNPNGDARYLEHDEISFAADKAWTVTTCLNGSGAELAEIQGYAGNSICRLGTQMNSISNYALINSTSTYINTGVSSFPNIGKNTTITYVADGLGNIYLYVNGDYAATNSAVSSVSFLNILRGRGFYCNSTINAHIIRSGALDSTQIKNEADWLQSIYPEIPYVSIDTLDIAVQNFDAVATPMGNVIAEVTDDLIWASSQSIYDDSITAGYTVYEATQFAAMWCYYQNDSDIGSIYGKLYNWFAVSLWEMDKDAYNAANPETPYGWHVPAQAELAALQTALGGENIAGGKMKVEGLDYWASPNTMATNSSGASVLGSGRRSGVDGTFSLITSNSFAYSYESASALKGYHLIFSKNSGALVLSTSDKTYGFPVRLFKDR